MQLSHSRHLHPKRDRDERASQPFRVPTVQIQTLHPDHYSTSPGIWGLLAKLDTSHCRVERILRHSPPRRYSSERPNMRTDNTQQHYRERECNPVVQFNSTERIQRHSSGHEWFPITLDKCLIDFRNPARLCSKLHSASRSRGWFEHNFEDNSESDSRFQRNRGSDRGCAVKP